MATTKLSGAAVVLSGGRSRRFGSDKALAVIDGQSSLQRVVSQMELLFEEVLIVGKNLERYANYAKGNVRLISDLMTEFHSMGGIYSGLRSTEYDFIFVAGCDMPLLHPDLICALWEARADFGAVVPQGKGRLQPLCAVYSRNTLDSMRECIDRGELKMQEYLHQIKARIFSEEEVMRFDPEGHSFIDIDTRQDLETVRSVLAARKDGV